MGPLPKSQLAYKNLLANTYARIDLTINSHSTLFQIVKHISKNWFPKFYSQMGHTKNQIQLEKTVYPRSVIIRGLFFLFLIFFDATLHEAGH